MRLGSREGAIVDNEFPLDIEAILGVIASAEVITFRFITVPQRLLIDARCGEGEGPMLRLVPRASSLEERFRALKQLRPRFRLPEKIVAVWWPKHIQSLETCGVWEQVVRRMTGSGFPDAEEQCRQAWRQMVQQERVEILNAITGTGYHTLWQRG